MITPIVFYLFASILLASAVCGRLRAQSCRFGVVPDPVLLQRLGAVPLDGGRVSRFYPPDRLCRRGGRSVPFRGHDARCRFPSRAARIQSFPPLSGVVVLALLAQLVLMASAWVTDPKAIKGADASEGLVENTRALGRVLFTDYFYPFQIAGFILLVAMVGAIVLTLRGRKGVRRQKARFQEEVRVTDVVEIRKVPSNKGVDL